MLKTPIELKYYSDKDFFTDLNISDRLTNKFLNYKNSDDGYFKRTSNMYLDRIYNSEESKVHLLTSAVICVYYNFEEIQNEDKRILVERAFISEVGKMLWTSRCLVSNGLGQYLYGIYKTPFQGNLNDLIKNIAYINTVIKGIQKYYNVKIRYGIGLDYGSVNCYSNDYSNPNFLIFNNKTVDNSMWLSKQISSSTKHTIAISNTVFDNIKDFDNNNELFVQSESYKQMYMGDVIITQLNKDINSKFK